jgi:hypothetical protein
MQCTFSNTNSYGSVLTACSQRYCMWYLASTLTNRKLCLLLIPLTSEFHTIVTTFHSRSGRGAGGEGGGIAEDRMTDRPCGVFLWYACNFPLSRNSPVVTYQTGQYFTCLSNVSVSFSATKPELHSSGTPALKHKTSVAHKKMPQVHRTNITC